MNKLLLVGVLLGSAVLLTACVRSSLDGWALVVNVKRDGEGCRVTIHGQPITSEQLLRTARVSGKHRAIVVYERGAPYKCIGGTIFQLQRAGFTHVEAATWDEG